MALQFFNSATFAGSINSGNITSTATISGLTVIARDNLFVDGGQLYIGADDGSTDGSFRQLVGSGAFKLQKRISGTFTNVLDFDSSLNATFAGNITAPTLSLTGLTESTTSSLFLVKDEALGAELVTNGDFDTDTSWTKGTGWTISGGKANAASASSDFTQSISISVNKTYRVTYTISNYSAGSFRVLLGSFVAGADRTANGTYSDIIEITNAGSNSLLYLTGDVSAVTLSVDNVSVKEIISSSDSVEERYLSSGAFGDELWAITPTNSNNIYNLNSGNVGIGTTAPESLLHIKGETRAYITFEDTTDGFIGFVGDAAQMLTSGTVDNLGLRGEGGIQFGVSDVIKMVLDSSGFLGIGTPTPAYPLEVESTGTAYLFSETTGAGGSSGFRWKTPDSEFAWYSSGGTNDMNLFDYEAGAIRMTINSSGGAIFKQDVTIDGAEYVNQIQARTGAGLKLGNDDNSGFIFIDDNSKIGIGTTVPSFQLSIENHDTTTSTATMELDGKRTNGTDGAVGELIFSNDGDTFATVAGFRDTADNKGSLQFQTQDSSFATRMTISSEGSVGIGTTTPQKKVHIEGTGGASEMQLLVSSASDTVGHTAGIGLRGEGGEADGDLRIKGGIFFERIAGAFGNGKMILAVNSSVSNTSVTVADHALTIDTDKDVGIGTTSPNARLDVKKDDGVASGLHIIADINQNAGAAAQMILGYYANGSATVGPLIYAANGMPQLINASGGINFSNDLGFNSNYLYTFRDGVGINNPNSQSAGGSAGYTMYVGRSSSGTVLGSISAKGTIRGSAFTSGTDTPAGIGASLGAINAGELGPGYINLSRDDTAAAQQIRFEKNGGLHSYFETTTSGLNIGNANVGIGVTSPGYKLDVESTTDALAGVYIQAGKSSQGEIQNTGLIIGSRTDIATGEVIGVSFSGNAAVPARGRAAIGAISTNGPSGMDLVFLTRNAGDGTQLGTGDEKMRITSGGNILIGTTDGENPRSLSKFLEIEAGDVCGIILNDSRDSHPMGIENAGAVMNFTYNTSPLMTILAGGNVGIGDTNPDAKFQVQGNVKVGSASGASWTDTKDDIGGLDVFVGSGSKAFQVWDDNEQTKPRFLVTRAGRVAIGSDVASYGIIEIQTEIAVAYSPTVFTNGSNIRLKSGGTATTGTTTGISFGVGGSAELYFGAEQQSSTYADAVWQTYNGSAYLTIMRLANSGTLTVTNDIVAFGAPSDKRLKENIKPIESALDKVSKLQGVTFDWKESDSILDIKEDIGFIAQDVQKVIPELVRENKDGMLSMRHQGIAPILLEAIKELKAEIEELKSNKCNCNK